MKRCFKIASSKSKRCRYGDDGLPRPSFAPPTHNTSIYAVPIACPSKRSLHSCNSSLLKKNHSDYGLYIHHQAGGKTVLNGRFNAVASNNGTSLVETNDQLLSSVIDNVQQLIDKTKEEEMNTSSVIESYKALLQQLHGHLMEIRDSLSHLYGLHDQFKGQSEQETSIRSFHFEFRALFLTLKYTLDQVFVKQLLKYRHVRSLPSHLMEKQARMLHVLVTLCYMATILMRDKMDAVKRYQSDGQSLEYRHLYYPFSDRLNIRDYEELIELDVKDYFETLGEQYAPMLKLFYGLMVTVTASHNFSLGYDPILRTPMFFASNLLHFWNSKRAAEQAYTFFTKNISIESGKGLWTMQDKNPIVKYFSFLILTPIEVSGVFKIPLALPKEFNKERTKTVREELKKQEEKQAENTKKSLHEGHIDSQLVGRASMKEFSFYCHQIPDILCSTKRSLPDNVDIRFISSSSLPNMQKNSKGEPSLSLLSDYPYMSTILRQVYKYGKMLVSGGSSQDTNLKKGLIFHVHGGGFLAMSSFSHECYLRPWAKQTNLPIISVDYTNTPDRQYPVQLEECYQAYKWVLENAEKTLGVSLDNIIFTGDSAGGNLILAVLLRAIQDGIRLPDGLALSYPATNLHLAPSPARIMSLLDPLLNFKLLELCGLEYYMNPKKVDIENNAFRNPFISPAMTPDEILKKFPRTYINVGSLDPLFDDSVYLAKRIEDVKGKEFIKFDVYDALGHGYLNLIDVVPESKQASSRLCDWINNIVDTQ